VYGMRGLTAEYAGSIDRNAKELKLRVAPIGHTARSP
jgi:hypothetical protein